MECKIFCSECNRNFKDANSLMMHNKSKHSTRAKILKKGSDDKLSSAEKRGWIIGITIFTLIVGLIVWGFMSIQTLPPSISSGHSEQSPPSNILKTPMSDSIQRHMLEHSYGNGAPGRIINYNCDNYDCSDDLIEKLEAFAIKYSDNVFVAPYDNMDSMIALTKEGSIKLLDSYDEEVISNFIL